MKSLARNLSALTILFTSGHGAADVIYSGFQNITIPTTYAGTYIDVDGMTFSSSPITTPGWDINPFMGGVYLSNNSAFQPARDGTGGMDTVLNFAAGSTISATGLNFATGTGGSMDHLGTSSALLPLFPATHEGYLGFKLDGANYGWMRVVFTNNSAGAKVLDWAYDTSGGAIATGNIVSDGSTVTLDSTHGSYTLSTLSPIGGSNNVAKDGAGTVILAGSNGYSGTTAVNVGTLLVNGSLTGSGTVSVASGAILGGTGSIAGAVTVNGGILAPGASIESLSTGALTLNAGSTFAYEMNSSAGAAVAADLQKVFGNLTLSGTVTLDLTDLAVSPTTFVPNTTFSLINYAGTWNGGFFTYAGNELTNHEVFTAGLNTWQINYDAISGGLNFATEYTGGHFVTLTAVPEPGSWLALG
ncbi:MAG: autotransporter-associated beta strand repeat-containing protein, partial [Verrucomicrobiota bacterium]